ncbi:HAMP domain-containing sensor histidine kinase [Paenibacillus sp. FSL P4-0338]|uniref:sensor histidine kinase n=1 Tax=unclassified Paenibacillus TaxID=185978 RepID=UPI0003E2625B|nr:HAMP domain-containing sensor histidine kinase [Paenibacillus sp. FSL R7-269]ETT56532.1 integral membrane sensor signal transduction histidine kinase [Paenibacillus sp. FSL R7-269]
MKRRIMKIWEKIGIVGPIAGMLIMLYISWNGSYFGSRLLVRHFGWSFSEYGYHLFVMAMQIIIFFVSGAIIAFATRGEDQNFYRPILTAMRQISQGDFKIELENSGQYRQFGGIVEGINEMASELSRMELMRQDFIASVSHEIQSPLTSIRGFAAALQEENLSPDIRKHYLDIIEAESRRLSGLSDNLLKLSVLEAESFPFERKPYRLDKQVQAMILAAEPQWLGKEIEVEAELQETTVSAVQDLLSQVWTNLLHNSIKFTPQGGRITVIVRSMGEWVEVEVRDSGIGMTEEELERIFERFYKADKSRSVSSGSGSGLGLPLVKKIVELHEGSVHVTSRPGEGTAFIVRLPQQSR